MDPSIAAAKARAQRGGQLFTPAELEALVTEYSTFEDWESAVTAQFVDERESSGTSMLWKSEKICDLSINGDKSRSTRDSFWRKTIHHTQIIQLPRFIICPVILPNKITLDYSSLITFYLRDKV